MRRKSLEHFQEASKEPQSPYIRRAGALIFILVCKRINYINNNCRWTRQDVAEWAEKPTPPIFLLPAEMMTAVLLAGHSEPYFLVQTWILYH
ncbi:rCG35453 [Rattus norvegicus]|uniref:RCG35453 n=1 Tax=Rattus norvegicus TaxID=10116 RepID=A6HHQ6_RAT|nr:rCG35453 [Rattus norvegicus]